ncbi:Afadin and alpha-actinin-binding-domain-containing protein [Halenospora varia]|nr:Afadin and alpha-actinin-binding-domain-containing protein [Halenospora varia]
MGRIMSVVNDLILRRDRDATQRENLSQTIRALRADGLRHTTDMERLIAKHTEAQRKLGLAEATERALKQQIRSAEQAARVLKEEMGRMKILVGQTRNQCANEVRKRERVMEGLKKHVGEGGRARGSGKAVGVVTVNVVAGVGGDSGNSGETIGLEDTNYDLRMETNEFLTELARGLSEDNENMGSLLRRTVETLRTLSGCEKEGQETGMIVQTEMGFEALASEMDYVIEHLRNLLTNPSFVPLEEVEIREEEIIRLREGWEKMESRWREAVQMMDGWRKRMARSGQTVNLEELKMGLKLSPIKPKEEEEQERAHRLQLSTLMEEGEGDTQADIDAMDDSGIPGPAEAEFDDSSEDSDSSLFEEEPIDEVSEEQSEGQTEEAYDEVSEEQQQDVTFGTESSLSPGPAPQLSPLRETSGNRGSASPQKEGFSTIMEENTWDLLQLDASSPQKPKPKSTPQPRREAENSQLSLTPPDEICLVKAPNVNQRSPRKVSNPTPKARSTPRARPTPKLQPTSSSRLPRPRDNPLPQQSPLTMASIAAKLAATEREADAARVRAKIKAAKLNRTNAANSEATKLMPPPSKSTSDDMEPVKGEAGIEASKKRKATGRTQGGRAARRRSTLSPWELESLILGGVNTASPAKGSGN